MFKKLSMLLAAVTLCTSVGIVLPTSAQAASGEVIVESNFQNCNLGTYTAANQMAGDVDLRNGIVMVDDSDLTTGVTIKNGNSFEGISEADIVNDGGVKVLRLNTFLKDAYVMTDGLTEDVANYPVVKSTAKVPAKSKVRIDLEVKISPRVSFYFHHSKPNHPNWRIWRIENGNSSVSAIKVLGNTGTGKTAVCNVYNTHTAILDTTTGDMQVYLNGDLIWSGTGSVPAWNQELFFRQISLNDASVKPTPKYIDEAKTQIESVTNPQYVYVKSVKMTTYDDTAVESVTPADGESLLTPTEAVFTFNNEIKSVSGASVYVWESGETVDVKSSLIYDGKTVKVPYAFAEDNTYTVTIEGATDGITTAETAETTFTAESWNFANLPGSPVNEAPADNNTYFINEDFTNSDNTNLVTQANRHEAWSVVKQDNTSIVELEDGNKVLKLAQGSDFRIFYEKSLRLLDNTTTLSYDVYLGKDTKQFNVDMQLSPVAMWQYGFFKQSGDANVPGEGPMTAGEWHRVDISISDETGKSIYVDGKLAYTQPKDTVNLNDVYFFRFRATGTEVLLDNFKLYLNKNETVLTDVTPAYGAVDAKASAPLTFTFNETIGDVTDAKLILKANDTNAPVVLTNGNGMSVNVDNYTVKVILDDALNTGLGYAAELSGLKSANGAMVSPVRTKFSTVADDEWTMTDIDTVITGPLSKIYSFKLKHQGEEKTAQFIAAVYDDKGSLLDVRLTDVLTVGSDWTDFSVEAGYAAGEVTRLFVWENMASATPLFGVISK